MYTSERTHARTGRRRVQRVLARAAVAGALSLPISSQAADIVIIPRTSGILLPRTGGAVIEAWAIGTLSQAPQPNAAEPCDLAHVCELAISSPGGGGTGTGVTVQTSFQGPAQGTLPSNLPFALSETIEYGHPAGEKSAAHGQGACYHASGVMAIAQGASTLVLDFVGQACQVGSSNAQLILTGSYATDSSSTGTFAHADGIGTININTPSGLRGTGTTLKASLHGQLKYAD